jgi:hypothetical protein
MATNYFSYQPSAQDLYGEHVEHLYADCIVFRVCKQHEDVKTTQIFPDYRFTAPNLVGLGFGRATATGGLSKIPIAISAKPLNWRTSLLFSTLYGDVQIKGRERPLGQHEFVSDDELKKWTIHMLRSNMLAVQDKSFFGEEAHPNPKFSLVRGWTRWLKEYWVNPIHGDPELRWTSLPYTPITTANVVSTLLRLKEFVLKKPGNSSLSSSKEYVYLVSRHIEARLTDASQTHTGFDPTQDKNYFTPAFRPLRNPDDLQSAFNNTYEFMGERMRVFDGLMDDEFLYFPLGDGISGSGSPFHLVTESLESIQGVNIINEYRINHTPSYTMAGMLSLGTQITNPERIGYHGPPINTAAADPASGPLSSTANSAITT